MQAELLELHPTVAHSPRRTALLLAALRGLHNDRRHKAFHYDIWQQTILHIPNRPWPAITNMLRDRLLRTLGELTPQGLDLGTLHGTEGENGQRVAACELQGLRDSGGARSSGCCAKVDS